MYIINGMLYFKYNAKFNKVISNDNNVYKLLLISYY